MEVLGRPFPPPALCEPGHRFEHAPELAEFARATLLDRASPLWNAEHEHLLDGDRMEAGIVYCWSNWPGKSRGRWNAGTCERFNASERQWKKARGLAAALAWWEGEEPPDFLITIDAPWWAECDDITAFALLDHEILHCGVELDEDGEPRYRQSDGRPIWRVKPHDVEVHLSEVERYGAYSPELRRLETALRRGPTIARASIEAACGTCGRKAA